MIRLVLLRHLPAQQVIVQIVILPVAVGLVPDRTSGLRHLLKSHGSQVIPHDISVQYAKEAARANASAEPVDLTGILEGLVIQIVNNTTVDGTPLKEMAAEYTIKRIGGQQRAVQRARGFA